MRRTGTSIGAAILLLVGAGTLAAQPAAPPAIESVPPFDARLDPAARGPAPAQPHSLLTARDLGASTLARLEAAELAAPDELLALETRNASGARPTQAGFLRPLPLTRPLTPADLTVTTHADGALSLSGLVQVDGAWGVRLHLAKVYLPAGSRLWSFGDDGIPQGPVDAAQITPAGDLYAPSASGSSVWVSIDVPAAAAAAGDLPRFEVSEAMELFRLDATGRPLLGSAPALNPACLVDISCVTPTQAIDDASRAISRYYFISNGGGYVCSGGLLNDTGGTGTPFFLTANHCMSTQGEVSTIEAWWDYRSSTCNGNPPGFSSVQKSFGGTLLSSSPGSDFTFLQLTSVPANRFFLGWTTSSPGTSTIERVSNPGGGQQVYSTTTNTLFPSGTCGGLPLSDFHYETQNSGAIAGGSSGSPSWTGAGIVVGQLFGLCGQFPNIDCDTSNYVIDGRFSSTFASIGGFLNGGGAVAPSAPTGLVARKIKKTKVTLKWTDTAGTEDSYVISEFDGMSFVPIGTIPSNSRKVKILGLAPATIYAFGVQACLTGSCSMPETQITVTTK